MRTNRTLTLAVLIGAIALARAAPAPAQVCHREGPVVTCDDGRRGTLSGDAIIWPDGTRSNASPHPSVIIGNKSSVKVDPVCSSVRARARYRWMTRTRRTRRVAPFSRAYRIATKAFSSEVGTGSRKEN